jgi:hypothetical protein
MLVTCFHAGLLLILFFDPEDRGDISLETLVDSLWTTQRYIPEDGTLHNHRWENLKSYKVQVVRYDMSSELGENDRPNYKRVLLE